MEKLGNTPEKHGKSKKLKNSEKLENLGKHPEESEKLAKTRENSEKLKNTGKLEKLGKQPEKSGKLGITQENSEK